MKNSILTVIGFHTGDAALAETLCDWIFELNGNATKGNVLLVSDSDVHKEAQTRVRLAAEVAFEHCNLVVAPPFERIPKAERVNHLFQCAAASVAGMYRLPWLWLEPDCVPLRQSWLHEISEAYYDQPMRYYGPHLKVITQDKREVMLLGRQAVYPVAAMLDVGPYCTANQEFNIVAGNVLVSKSTKCRLIQQLVFSHETDPGKIRSDAVILHSDKAGLLIQRLRQEIQPGKATAPISETGPGEPVPTTEPPKPPRRGRPKKEAPVLAG